MGREPTVNSRGVPVRRGAYNPNNRHGELQDVSGDGQVSFADTFLGDLLGFDGQVGTQGRPGMAASIAGARRKKAIEAVQAQGLPVTEQNVQRAMPMVSDEPAVATPEELAVPEVQTEVLPPNDGDEIPRDADGNPLVVAGAAAGAAGVAALVARAAATNRNRHDRDAARRELQAMGRGLDGEVLDAPQLEGPSRELTTGEQRRYSRTGATPDDVEITITPTPTENMVAGPNAAPAIENIDGSVTDGPAPTENPNQPRALIASPEDAPISTEEIIGGAEAAIDRAATGGAVDALPPGSQVVGARQGMGGLTQAIGPDGSQYVQGTAGKWMPIVNGGPDIAQIVRMGLRGAF